MSAGFTIQWRVVRPEGMETDGTHDPRHTRDGLHRRPGGGADLVRLGFQGWAMVLKAIIATAAWAWFWFEIFNAMGK